MPRIQQVAQSTAGDSQKKARDQALERALASLVRGVVVRSAKALAYVLTRDWEYVVGYVAAVLVLRFLLGWRYLGHVDAPWQKHWPIPLLLCAALLALVAAHVRYARSERALADIRRQAKGVATDAIPTRSGQREPRVHIKTNRSGELVRVVVHHLPYRLGEDDAKRLEELWSTRVPDPPGHEGWRFDWQWSQNRLLAYPQHLAPLPSKIDLDPSQAPEGLAFRLGQSISEDGSQPEWVRWDPDAADPHILVTGPTRSGKSIALRVLLCQALAGEWLCYIGDPKGVDYRWADGLPGIHRASGDNAFEAVDWAIAEMKNRQAWMEEHAPRTAANLGEVTENPFKPCLVLLDETAELLELGGEGEDKEKKQRRTLTLEELGSLARRSRFVQMVMCVATQRADARLIPVEIRGNLGTRVLTGEGEPGHKQMAFGQALAAVSRLPKNYPAGRGRVMVGGGLPREMQVPWISTQAILDRHLPPDEPLSEGDPDGPPPPAPESEGGSLSATPSPTEPDGAESPAVDQTAVPLDESANEPAGPSSAAPGSNSAAAPKGKKRPPSPKPQPSAHEAVSKDDVVLAPPGIVRLQAPKRISIELPSTDGDAGDGGGR